MEYIPAIICCPEDPNVDAKLLLEKSGVKLDTYIKAAKLALGRIPEARFIKLKEFFDANGFVIEPRIPTQYEKATQATRKKADGVTSFNSDDYHEAYGSSLYGPT
jgi:hypothetical protein